MLKNELMVIFQLKMIEAQFPSFSKATVYTHLLIECSSYAGVLTPKSPKGDFWAVQELNLRAFIRGWKKRVKIKLQKGQSERPAEFIPLIGRREGQDSGKSIQ